MDFQSGQVCESAKGTSFRNNYGQDLVYMCEETVTKKRVEQIFFQLVFSINHILSGNPDPLILKIQPILKFANEKYFHFCFHVHRR